MKNLLIRTASGIVFLVIFLTALLWHPIAYCAIFAAVVMIMIHEYLEITIGKKHGALKFVTIFNGTLLFVLMFLHVWKQLPWQWLLIVPIFVMISYCIILFSKDKEDYRSTPFAIASLLYIALPFSMTNLIAFGPDGSFNGIILLTVMIMIWGSDVGAYLVGMTLGRKFGHKLCPNISPNKSWEGYFGGLIFAILSGYILSITGMTGMTIIYSIILAIIVNITSTLGDLAESQLKRNFGVKDAGKIMPGHGGLLDRFDGALFAFPSAVLFIILTLL